MGIGLTEDQRDLAAALADWAAGHRHRGGHQGLRERSGPRRSTRCGRGSTDIGRPRRSPLPESAGGSGRHPAGPRRRASRPAPPRMVPGPLLPTAVAASSWRGRRGLLADIAAGAVTVALGIGDSAITLDGSRASGECRRVWGSARTTHVLLPTTRRLAAAPVDRSRATSPHRSTCPAGGRCGSTASTSAPTGRRARPACGLPGRGDAGGRRGRRHRPLVPGHRRGLRQGARAVRPADRVLPGDQAPVRRDAGDRASPSPPSPGTPPPPH